MTPPETPVDFFVAGRPAAQGSKSYKGKGQMVEASRFVAPWRTDVREEAKKHFPSPFDGAIDVELEFHYPRPASHYKKNGDRSAQWTKYKTTMPDLDKMVRSTLDGLTGIAFIDDRQVVEIRAWKRFVDLGETQGCFVYVSEKDGSYSIYGD